MSFFNFLRLEEHGLVLAREDDGDKDGGGEGSKTTVLVRTSKKWMDQERYLDATQRCVPLSSRRALYSYFFARSLFVCVVVKGES